MKEADIQRGIVEYLRGMGYFVHRMPLGSVRHAGKGFKPHPLKGFPDLFFITSEGQIVVIEVKGPKGKLSPQQIKWKQELTKRNVPHLVARSVEDVECFLKKLDIGP